MTVDQKGLEADDMGRVAHDMLHLLVSLHDLIKIKAPGPAETIRKQIDALAERYGRAHETHLAAYEAAKGEAKPTCAENAQVEPVAWNGRDDAFEECAAYLEQNMAGQNATSIAKLFRSRKGSGSPTPAPGLDGATIASSLDHVISMTSAITSSLDADCVDISWHRELASRLAALRALLNPDPNGGARG